MTLLHLYVSQLDLLQPVRFSRELGHGLQIQSLFVIVSHCLHLKCACLVLEKSLYGVLNEFVDLIIIINISVI